MDAILSKFEEALHEKELMDKVSPYHANLLILLLRNIAVMGFCRSDKRMDSKYET